ncbi:MAG: hypothetical protein IJI59_08455, partial [Clostridia bacterium]|nr:hypothetical protein [Clostridia bacterium]
MNKLSKAGMSRLGPVFKNGLIIAATYLLLAGLLVIGITPEQHDIQIGSPAPLDILASKDIVDTVRTEERRAAAAAAVEPSYKSIDFSVVGSVSSEMQAIFDTLFALRDSEWPDPDRITEDELSALNASLPVNLSPEEYRALRTSDVDNLRHLFEDAIIDVRETLNSTLLEGQEVTAINRLARSLAGKGYSAELVSIAMNVIRSCIRPNMLIDEETTEANRQKARDEVENVTCVKGEVIVRRGDIVTQAQYAMLSSLGLLKEDSLDVQLIGGIALILLLIMGCMGLYLHRYLRERMTPRTLLLLGLISVLVTGLCLAFSRFDAYMMPISLGLMLVAVLFDQRSALYMNIGLGFIASLLTNASSGLFSVTMFSVLLMSMVSGPIILSVL